MNTVNQLKELWLHEHQTLRQEVLDLKECQIDILKWAYSILGAVLAFSWGLVLASGNEQAKALLNPKQALPAAIVLLIGTIIGSFLVQIIAHKTRSVFRMCGYIRVLEKLLSRSDHPKTSYPGYENAFNMLRIIQQKGKTKGFDIPLGYAIKEFFNDIKDKLPSFLKRKKKSNNKDKNIPSPSSGNYYRRIAFQVHFLAFLSLVSAIFLLVISSNIPPWRTITWIFGFIAAGFWVLSYIRCTAQTRMQESGKHSIDGQFSLWRKAMTKCNYPVDI